MLAFQSLDVPRLGLLFYSDDIQKTAQTVKLLSGRFAASAHTNFPRVFFLRGESVCL